MNRSALTLPDLICDLSRKHPVDRLFDDLERGLLAVTGSSTGEQGANGANGLAVAPDNTTDITLAHLEAEVREATLRNFRQHDLVGIFDQLPNDKFEELQHVGILPTGRQLSIRR